MTTHHGKCDYCGAPVTYVIEPKRHYQYHFCNRKHAHLFSLGKDHPERRKYTREQLLSALRSTADALQRKPRLLEVTEHTGIYKDNYKKHFGSFEHACYLSGVLARWEDWTPDKLTPEQGGWLAGFVAGEGSFGIAERTNGTYKTTHYTCTFNIGVRSDDIEALQNIHAWLDLHVPIRHRSRHKDRSKGMLAGDAVTITITDISTLYHKLVLTFRRYPLRTKKQRDFEIFDEAVSILYKKLSDFRYEMPYTHEERERLSSLKKDIGTIKRYDFNSHLIQGALLQD